MSEPQPAFPEPSVSTQPRPVAADAGPRPEKAAPTARKAASTPAGPKKPRAAAAKPKKAPAAKAKPKTSGSKPAAGKPTTKTSTRPSAESGAPAKPRSRGAASATGSRARAPRRKTAAWPAPQPQATPAERAAAAQTPPAADRPTPVAPKAPAPVAKATPPVAPVPPVAPKAHAPVAKATPPAKPAPPMAPTPPVAPAPPVAHEIPEPVDPAPQAEMAPLAPTEEISVPLTAWVPPTPPVAPTPEVVAEASVAPEPPVADHEPVAPEQPIAPEQPVASEQPPAAPAPRPISLAGADVPAMLLPQWQPTPPVEPAPAAAPDPAPGPAPEAPSGVPAHDVAATGDDEPASKAPPGFTHSTIRAAESPTLLALDPVDDETTAPEPAPKAEARVGGSAILSAVAGVLPRRGDRHAFGADRAATIRLSVSVLVAALVVAVVGPPAARAIAGLPVIGAMFDQLDSFRLYPGAYGLPWVAAVLGTLSIAGIVVAQMEKTADRFDRRKDPVTRLNIGLAGVLSLALSGAALTAFSSNGWAAAGASVAFFLSACLLVPAAALPGARAMAHQPERAWALLAIVSLVGLVISPSFPLLAILLLAFTRVRTNWAAVSRGDDLHRSGPIDGTNRLSAILITMFVILAASVGMNAMTLSADEIRAADVESTPAVPGTERGPTIAPPTP